MASTDIGGPTLIPPRGSVESVNESTGASAPTLPDPGISLMVEAPAAPTLLPPLPVEVGTGAAAADGVTATWRTNVTIDALWCIDETRNAFAHVVDVGWRKIYNGRDGAFQALVALASQARQTNRPASLREEADGMIYEIYLW